MKIKQRNLCHRLYLHDKAMYVMMTVPQSTLCRVLLRSDEHRPC